MARDIENTGKFTTETDLQTQFEALQDAETRADLAAKVLGLKAPGLDRVAEQLNAQHQADAEQFRETALKSGVMPELWSAQDTAAPDTQAN